MTTCTTTVNQISYPALTFASTSDFLVIVPRGTFSVGQWVHVGIEASATAQVHSIVPVGSSDKCSIRMFSK